MDNPPQQQSQQSSNNYVMPSQLLEAQQQMASLTRLLTEISQTLISLRREFRGEALWQDDKGENHWVQVSKPTFIRMDQKTNTPIKKKENMPWGEDKWVYEPNDEAIDEVISMLKFSGINQVTPVAGVDNNTYLDNLREFGCKLASTLALKQKSWGLDKELLPMVQYKIYTIVQDARSLALDGRTLKALQTTVQRMEQSIEEIGKKSRFANPYQ